MIDHPACFDANSTDQLAKAAKAVLRSNILGKFTKPAPSLYPHQWNWDAGFIALVGGGRRFGGGAGALGGGKGV